MTNIYGHAHTGRCGSGGEGELWKTFYQQSIECNLFIFTLIAAISTRKLRFQFCSGSSPKKIVKKAISHRAKCETTPELSNYYIFKYYCHTVSEKWSFNKKPRIFFCDLVSLIFFWWFQGFHGYVLGAKIETLQGFMKPDKKINLNYGFGFRGGGLRRSPQSTDRQAATAKSIPKV